MKFRFKELIHELKHHAPFTAFATIIAVAIVILIQYYFHTSVSRNAFEIFHPIHVIASAMVTAGIFYKYKKNIFSAALVGISGAIIIGSLSDVIIPWLSGNILNLQTVFHLPLIEEPGLILGSAIIGSFLGISTRITTPSHFIHVLLSVFASLFYLLAFTPSFNFLFFIAVFFIVLIAVIIPCCISDILYPFFFLKVKIKHCDC